eukprot:799998-Pleurochrysis_carterae.AAC.1
MRRNLHAENVNATSSVLPSYLVRSRWLHFFKAFAQVLPTHLATCTHHLSLHAALLVWRTSDDFVHPRAPLALGVGVLVV